MTVYLWREAVGYPSWAECHYDQDLSADRYRMMDGTPPQPGERLVFQCDVTRQRIASWESIPNNSSHPLVSQRLAGIFCEHAAQCIELLEPEIECSDGMLEGYSLVLVKHLIPCVNLEQSEPKYDRSDGMLMGYKMSGDGSEDDNYRVKYDEKKLADYPLVRDADFEPYILLSGALAEAIAAEGFKGLRLVDVTASGA